MGAIRTNMSVVLLMLCCCTQVFVQTAIAQPNASAYYNYQDIYETQWSGDHIDVLNNGTEVQLVLDAQSGCGFQSQLNYTYGYFGISAKLVAGYSAGVVAAFFVSSSGPNHDEIDFEFLGNVSGQNVLQTNMFANGTGGREQHMSLWFDPTADFHTYEIIWNHAQIIWLVDQTPIRVFKNLESIGQAYPTYQPAQVIGVIFDGSGWATHGPSGAIIGVNYTYAPFILSYEGFQLDACVNDGVDVPSCSSNYQNNWWEGSAYTNLTADQISTLEYITETYSSYNYCKDPSRYNPPPVECSYNYNS
ncbi:unnamed protein product [Calypogeia fissa]